MSGSSAGKLLFCPRCLSTTKREDALWIGHGKQVDNPPRPRRFPTAAMVLRAAWDGEPARLHEPDYAVERELLAGDYHQIDEAGHRLVSGIPIGLVGAAAAGKSIFLTALYGRAGVDQELAHLGLVYAQDPAAEAQRGIVANHLAVFENHLVLPPSQPGENQASLPPVALTPTNHSHETLLFFDADGSLTGSAATHARYNPAMLASKVLFLFVPPPDLKLDGLQRQADDQQPHGATLKAITEAIAALRQAKVNGDELLACVILSKSDRLPEHLDPDLRDLVEDAGSPSSSFDDLLSVIDQDSRAIRAFLRNRQPGLVQAIEDFFGTVSYHFASGSGSSAVVLNQQARFPVVEPKRVLDPLLVALRFVGFRP